IENYEEMAQRVVRMVRDKQVITFDNKDASIEVDTVCIHADTPGATTLAKAIVDALEQAKIELTPVKKNHINKMDIRKKMWKPESYKTPLMEYTRFPQAAARPPRAFSSLGVSPGPFLLQESRIFHSLGLNSIHFPHENTNTQ